jgi:hypothetical protein
MEKQWTLEKLGGRMYRCHNVWDGTSEMLDWLKEKGFSASSDSSDDYFHDFEEDDDHFNFGASMSECFQVLCDNQHFCTAFILALAMGNKDARLGKQLVETKDPIDILFPLIRLMKIDNFMYLIARNYNKSLGDQAKEMYKKQDEDGLITWMKGVVEPRFSGNVTPEEIRQYLVIDENPFKGINFLDAFYDSWCCVKENEEAFRNWIKVNEIPMKNPAEIFNDCILHPNDETTKLFALCYWFGDVPCACHLFLMLNDEAVSIGVKTLLRNTLTDYGKGEAEFAKQLQSLYDEYKSIAGGIDIAFETASAEDANRAQQLTEQFEDSLQQEPQPELELEPFEDSLQQKPQSEPEQLSPADFNQVIPDSLTTEHKKIIKEFEIGKRYFTEKNKNRSYELRHCTIINEGFNSMADEDKANRFKRLIQLVARKRFIYPSTRVMRSCAYAMTGYGFNNPFEPVPVFWNPKKVDELFYICQRFYNKRGDAKTPMSNFKNPAEVFHVIKEYQEISNRSQSASRVDTDDFGKDFKEIFPEL